ncbi:hypothetical protein [Nocardia sp. CY41]|uniref:hypothetical protein n=1 Tax=Nocardia sp. CY41 TaxID=2608686 RepID=UPI0013588FF0|nr:hypothetical protein [Nocardia sp. CY41]
MKALGVRLVSVVAAAAVMPAVITVVAHAEDGTLYFSLGNAQCSIASDGTVGCDYRQGVRMTYRVGETYVTLPFPVRAVVIDQPWLPAHPEFTAGDSHSLPGGNPNFSDVATGTGPWGPFVNYGGAHCEVGFRGSFACQSKGHAFSEWSGEISA